MNIRIVLAIAIAIVSVLAGASSQLDIIFGHTLSTVLVAVFNLASAIMAAVIGVLSTQASQAASVTSDPTQLLKALQAMPGVSSLLVNGNASPALATAAVSPENSKIVAAPGQEQKVNEIAANAQQ